MATGKQKATSATGRSLGLKILGFLALSAWMFGLGVWVGRGTAPLRFDIAKLETELAELKGRLMAEEQQRTALTQEAAGDWSNLDFYEALKKTGDEPLPNPKAPPAAAGAADTGSGEATRTKKSLKLATRTAPSPPGAVKAAPAAKTPPAAPAKPQPAPQPAGDGGLTIQVASLKDPADAARLVLSLQAKGFAAYRVTAQVPGSGSWHRVRVGVFKDRAAAQAVLERLKNEKFGGLVVSR
ncbi:MAG: SPOR domain-containing protein [Desulfobacteraceae bacterium]|jgi:cell division septation protein DedD